jgi:hypothetical protein
MEINLDRYLAITALLAAAGVTACVSETVDTGTDAAAAGAGGTAGTGGTAGSGGTDAAMPDGTVADQATGTDVSADQATGDAAGSDAGQGDAIQADQVSPDAGPDQTSPEAGACLADEPESDAATDAAAADPTDPCYEIPVPSPSAETVCDSGQIQCIQYAGRVKPAVFAKMLECLKTVTLGDAGTCDGVDAASQKCIDDAFGLACLPTGTACDGIAAACVARGEEYPEAGAPVAEDGGTVTFPGITAAACKRALAPLTAADQTAAVTCFNDAWATPYQSCESIFTICVQSGSVE